ncbi:OmpW/AlkL family protein [Lysobacter silvisoli]|uniref:OmpW family protein n=1 Tax=Lysobacter silvisoli TaxID=2293254 RepID=A0A371JZ60_9GAMM|nr:OmpW family outer membrane protein [Lysobacter silvisoli]RDZ26965.1 OmpW family protein [Lysobacter silvisoli]
MNIKRMQRGAIAALVLACLASPAYAQQAGTWTLGIGAHQVSPKSDNGTVLSGTADLEIDKAAQPTITFEYFVHGDIGIEVLAALPFKHDIDVVGAGRVASTKQLPPTVSVQYHFNSHGVVSPFIGVGLNYTAFFEEETRGALAGTSLKLKDSWGPAAHAGIDIPIGDHGAVRVDVRWMDIDSEVQLNGVKIGTAEIDPLVYGVAYVMQF